MSIFGATMAVRRPTIASTTTSSISVKPWGPPRAVQASHATSLCCREVTIITLGDLAERQRPGIVDLPRVPVIEALFECP